jgi:hypothetical protein
MWMDKTLRPALWLALSSTLGGLSACAANHEADKPAEATQAAVDAPGKAQATPSTPTEVPAPAQASERYASPYRDPDAAQKLIDQYKEGIGRRPAMGRN